MQVSAVPEVASGAVCAGSNPAGGNMPSARRRLMRYPRCRRYLHRRGIKLRIARRGIEDKTKLGRHRWLVGRTASWLLRFKRLGLR
jgi:hypothetical protein